MEAQLPLEAGDSVTGVRRKQLSGGEFRPVPWWQWSLPPGSPPVVVQFPPVPTAGFISARAALERLARGESAVDVRSPGEFARGAFPGSANLPILDDDSRAAVGTAYKRRGREQAIAVGHELVAPVRDEMIAAWKTALSRSTESFLFCWRGGLRSRIACSWLAEVGVERPVVADGYKAMRDEARSVVAEARELLVISGFTGSGKTEAFAGDPDFLDLELHADHRGSAFGRPIDRAQRSQQEFENRLAVDLLTRSGRILVEDESRLIGNCEIPVPLYESLRAAPTIFVDCPVEERAARVFRDYVLAPLSGGTEPELLEAFLLDGVRQIARRLGDERARRVAAAIGDAFAHRPEEPGRHTGWISDLLVNYYDRAYEHARRRKNREVLFRGPARDCVAYVEATRATASDRPQR